MTSREVIERLGQLLASSFSHGITSEYQAALREAIALLAAAQDGEVARLRADVGTLAEAVAWCSNGREDKISREVRERVCELAGDCPLPRYRGELPRPLTR